MSIYKNFSNIKHYPINHESGYIVLTTVLIISSLIAIVFVGVFTMSAGEIDRGINRMESERAGILANICAEKALNEIRKDSDYAGNESLNLYGGSCNVLPVEGSWATSTIIKTEGGFNDKNRIIIIEISTTTPAVNVVSWREIE